MKDKEKCKKEQKEIEEMARVLAECNTTCDECFEKLERVMTMKIKEREKHCQAYLFAKRAIEQGYRNCKDKVVLSKEEYENIKELKYDKFNLKIEISEKDKKISLLEEIIDCIKFNIDFTRKETARKIYKKGKEHDDDFDMTSLGEYIMANFLTDENSVKEE